MIGDLGAGVVALRDLSPNERVDATLAAMREGATLIHGGRITADDLLGEPDLLIRRDGHYIAADIKSGRGETGGDEDEDDGKLKPHYAVQVALYADVLNRLGFGAGHVAEIWVRMRIGGASNRNWRDVLRGNFEAYRAARAHGLKVTPFFVLRKILSRLPQFFARPA